MARSDSQERSAFVPQLRGYSAVNICVEKSGTGLGR